jgi:hypothetical protein
MMNPSQRDVADWTGGAARRLVEIRGFLRICETGGAETLALTVRHGCRFAVTIDGEQEAPPPS